MKHFLLVFVAIFVLSTGLRAQCAYNNTAFGASTAPTIPGVVTPLTTCIFGGEYRTITGLTIGSSYTISTCGSSVFDTQITLYPTGGGTVLGYNDDFCGLQSSITFTATTTSVDVLVDEYNCLDNSSCASLDIVLNGGVVDPCMSVQNLICGNSATVSLSGAGAGWTLSGSSGCFATPGAEQVYQFTAPITGTYTLTVSGGSGSYIDYAFKPVSAGCGSAGWTCIDDMLPTSAAVTFNLSAGTYYILADAEGTAARSQTFSINCGVAPPPNPCNVIATLPCGTPTTATLAGSGAGWSVTNCYFLGTPGAEQVYQFTATATGNYTLSVTSATGGYIDYFYKPVSAGCGPTGWTCIDDIAFAGSTTFTLAAGDYYILLDGEATGSRTQTFNISCASVAPPNDLCSGAILLGLGQTLTGNTANGTPDTGPICNSLSIGTGGGVWYKVIGTGGFLTASLCDPATTYDSKLHVFTGGCSALICVNADDDGCDSPGLASTVTWCSVQGQTYYVLVNGFSTAQGPFAITLSGATPVITLSGATNVCESAAPYTIGADYAGGTFSGPGMSGSTFNPSLAGPGVHTITYTLCGASASLTITVTGTPSNDICANALPIGANATVTGSTVCATSDVAPTCGTTDGSGGGVWYTLVGTGNRITASMCIGSDYDTKLRVYTGSCGALVCETGVDDFCGLQSEVTWCSQPGTTYYILVHGYSTSVGNFTLTTSETVLAPILSCGPDQTLDLNGTTCSAVVPDFTATATASDDCSPTVTLTQSPAAGTSITDAGVYTVTVTATDGAGNTSFCNNLLTLQDITPPSAICQDVTVQLDQFGNGSITAQTIDNGSNDACGIASINAAPLNYSCQNVGANTATLTVTDLSGNVSTCTATVTVEDNVAPSAVCQDVTVTLDNVGAGSITPQDIDGGSGDICGIASLSADLTNFGCGDLGANTVTLTVTDVNGNSSTCTATVTVVEGNFTEIQCPADLTAYCETGEGGAFVTWDDPVAIAYTSCTEPCTTANNLAGFQSLGNYGGNQYFRSNGSHYTWAQANAAALAAGGHLVVINDAGENNFLNANINCAYIWLGYTDQVTEGNFDWVNGDPDTYTNWQQGEPNNNGGGCCYGSSGSDYAVMNSNNGRWYDRGGCDHYAFVVEIPCQNPVTVTQIGGPAPGSLFNEGTTTITYVATNGFGTTDTCSFEVTVEERFEIVCPDDIYVECNSGNGGGYGHGGYGNCGGGNNNNSGGQNVSWPAPDVLFDNCRQDACPGNTCITGFSYLGEYNGHRYYYRNGNYSWGQAFTAAQNAGGYLATINDAGENSFISSSLNASYAWIGLNDAGVEGTFRWSNNEPVSYTNWQPGEPNNSGSGCCGNAGADYAVIRRSNGRWYDQGSCADYGFVMEIPCFGYTLVQTEGPASGSFFADGTTTTIGYMAYTPAGDTVRCSFEVELEDCPPSYCESEGHNTCHEWIDNITLCDVNNTSGNDGGYGDYTSLTANLVAGQQYTIGLTPGYSNQQFREYWRVWIDWNRDGDFNDAQELAFQGNGYGPGSGTISVPSWASNRPVRMRVSMRWNGYASSACSDFQYGEVEDYTIQVNSGGGLKTAPDQPESSTAAFTDTHEEGPVSGFEFVQVYPNPAIQAQAQQIAIDFRSGMDEDVAIRMMDMSGRVVLDKQVNALRGVNTEHIKISNLSVGTYLLEVSGSTEKAIQQVVIQ